MRKKYAVIGPNVFVDHAGVLYKRADSEYVPVKNKYTEAEDRFVKRQMEKKGRVSK